MLSASADLGFDNSWYHAQPPEGVICRLQVAGYTLQGAIIISIIITIIIIIVIIIIIIIVNNTNFIKRLTGK